MKKFYNIILLCIVSTVFFSCSDWVDNIDPLVTQTEDKNLQNEKQLPFLINGVETSFAYTTGQLLVCADGLSDAFVFEQSVPNATYPQFDEIDRGEIQLDNSSCDNILAPLGELRFYSDDLVRRTTEISVSSTELKNRALFTGYFYGGYARYYYGVYFGITPTRGGGTINAGPFIPSDQMLEDAIAKFKAALPYAADEAQTRIVNSVIARAYLYKGDYVNAALFAAGGMKQGDTPFLALHNAMQDNYWWEQAGALRAQFTVDFRFPDFIKADPNEANRIKLAPVEGVDGVTYYYQVISPEDVSPQVCMSWQENNLMLAELALRGNSAGAPLTLVNEVRASHNIDPLAQVEMSGLIVERDKELLTQGARLPDERRFGIWHLPADRWQYLPITLIERNANPYID
jgi:hypothetical protein